MSLFQRKSFELHSGGVADFKIECDDLTDEDIETLAFIISKKVKFSKVIGVPTGGNRIEEALLKYVSSEGPWLIVDDVLTTGTSMEEVKSLCDNTNIIGIVLFARGKCSYWIKPVFQIWED